MAVITIKPSQLGAALKREGERHVLAVRRATHAAAMKFKARLILATNEAGISDRGVYRNSFVVEKTPRGAVVRNDAPYAGIIELGARPHKVGREVIELLAAWARRKIAVQGPVQEHVKWKTGANGIPRATVKTIGPKLSKDAAMDAAWAIAHKIAEEGVEGRFIFRDNMHLAARYYAEELARIMSRDKAT